MNDPVAEKMLGQLDEMPKLVPPEDTTITTLYVGGLTPDITEQHIKDQFYGHGEIMSVRKVSGRYQRTITYLADDGSVEVCWQVCWLVAFSLGEAHQLLAGGSSSPGPSTCFSGMQQGLLGS